MSKWIKRPYTWNKHSIRNQFSVQFSSVWSLSLFYSKVNNNVQIKEKLKWNMKKCCPLVLFFVTATIKTALMGTLYSQGPGAGSKQLPSGSPPRVVTKKEFKTGQVFREPISAAAAKSLQSCPTLCDPRDGSPPGSPIPGILQARTLEWVAISFSNAWTWKVKAKSLSRVRLFATPWTTAYQAPQTMGFSRQKYWSGLPLPISAGAFNSHPLRKVTRCHHC